MISKKQLTLKYLSTKDINKTLFQKINVVKYYSNTER